MRGLDPEVAPDQQVDEGTRPRHAFAMRSHAAMLGICVVAWCGVARAADSPPPTDAPAQPPAATPGADQIQFAAREHDLGYRAYLNKQYDEAASHFENAFFAAPNPAELRSAVRARRDAGELARAATLGAIGQRRFPDDAATNRVAADAIAQARPHVYEVQLASSAEYSVAIDEKIVAAERAKESRLFVNPGAHELLVSWSDDRNTRIPIDAKEGGSQSLQLEPPASPVPAVPPIPAPVPVASPVLVPAPVTVPPAVGPVPPPSASKPFGPAVFITGAALTAIGAGFTVWSGIDTVNNPGADRVKAECSAGKSDCPNLYQTGRNAQTRTNVLVGVTSGVAALTAIVGLFFTQWSPAVATVGTHAAPPPRLLPVLGIGPPRDVIMTAMTFAWEPKS
jgi:hypothetical protein